MKVATKLGFFSASTILLVCAAKAFVTHKSPALFLILLTYTCYRIGYSKGQTAPDGESALGDAAHWIPYLLVNTALYFLTA